MAMLTPEIINSIVDLQEDEAVEVSAALNQAMEWAEINTPQRAAAFLAQLAHESTGFTVLEENLNYSATRLLQVFPRYFTQAQARQYARNPEAIASRVYANRMGNGDEASGDGWAYRGRGPIQLTGRENYQKAGEALSLSLVEFPDQVATWQVGAYVGAWFWNVHGLNEFADNGDFIAITRRINGGLNGLQDRQRYWALAKEALGAT